MLPISMKVTQALTTMRKIREVFPKKYQIMIINNKLAIERVFHVVAFIGNHFPQQSLLNISSVYFDDHCKIKLNV